MAITQGEYDIHCYRGDSKVIEMRFTDIDNSTGVETPTNLTNILVSAQVRYDADNTDVWLNLSPVIADAVNGLIRITITATASAGLAPPADPLAPVTGKWDLEFKDKTSSAIVFTPIVGNFTVEKDVTR
ncbi:hypothetical protein [Aeromonas dhakensis]|uniref:hypothetical protein n=1 Tax=Aeromonas dhakensis TaxID=196024 RepID=UPI001119D463|nr:hypothetical protein [Aeromonas dhakensis]